MAGWSFAAASCLLCVLCYTNKNAAVDAIVAAGTCPAELRAITTARQQCRAMVIDAPMAIQAGLATVQHPIAWASAAGVHHWLVATRLSASYIGQG
jgi:hypothetical protein